MDEPNRLRMGGPAALLSMSLTAAWVEAAVGIGTGPGYFENASRVTLSLGVTGLILFLLSIPQWGVVSLFARRAGESHAVGRALGSSAFLASAVILGSMARVLVWPLYNADLLRWLVIIFISLPVGLGAGRGVKAVLRSYPGETRLVRLLYSCPVLAALLFFLVWWIRYHLESLASLQAVGVAAGGAVALAVVAATSAVVRKASTSFLLLGMMLAAVILVPGWTLLREARAEGASTGGMETVRGVPRVILISVDTLRADVIGAYGEGGTETPSMDALAGESLVFTEAFSASPWTLPSLATLLTGFHPDVHGMRRPGARLPDALPTLAERMKRAGYRTAFIGANPHLGTEAGLDRGFDQYLTHGGSPPFITSGPFGAKLLQKLFEPAFPRAGTTHELTELTLRWLRGSGQDPFFLWLHFLDPHVPHTPPAGFLPGKEPPEGMGLTFDRQNELRNGYFKPNSQQRDWIRELYLAEVRYVDQAVGRVVKELKRMDLYEGSLILLTSDHGEEFWEHGGYEHGHSLYRETLRVPLMIRGPGVTPGRSGLPISTQRVAATLLDLAGVSAEESSLVREAQPPPPDPNAPVDPNITGDPNTPPAFAPVVSTALLYHEDRVGVLFESWKYIRPLVTDSEELFDLAVDPGERLSIPANRRDKVGEAAAHLRAHYGEARQIRESLGVLLGTEELDEQTLEQLRSLGYVD